MTIIAVDPGSHACGYAVMTDMDTIVKSGTIKAKRTLPFYERLRMIADELTPIANGFGCSVLAIEDQYSGSANRRSGLQVAKASGYIVHALLLPVVEIAASKAKSWTTDNGSASKELVRYCIINRYPDLFKGVVIGHDEADAVAIGIAYYAEYVFRE